MRILWTHPASRQFDQAYVYLRKSGSASAATRQMEAVLRALEQLRNFPELGRPGRVDGTRELVIQGTPYVLAYRTREDAIEILTLLHGARRWPAQL